MQPTYKSIAHWAEDDQPREKLMLRGRSALTDAELLAILIGSGSRNESAVDLCKRILAQNQNHLHLLGKLSIQQLMEFKGIGEAKAITIIAALELGKRIRQSEVKDLIKITCSKDAFNIIHPIIGDLYHEEFWVLYLNNANKVIHKCQISKGGISGTIVDNRLVFKAALEHHATGIILSHNHPSGRPTPSHSDFSLTKKIKIAGEALEIKLLDHIIVTANDYYSFADEEKL